jgi:hypothetical protein
MMKAGVVLPRHSRWVLFCTRKRIGRKEERDGGSGNDFDGTRRPPAEPTGWIELLQWSRIERVQ